VSRALIPLALAIGLIAAGCGSDNSGETTAPTPSIPAVTSPGISTSTAPAQSTKPATTVTTTGGKTYNPSAPDSATNDVPPAKGSPQAQFEKQCEQNPAACG
jgi:hypothetical protein